VPLDPFAGSIAGYPIPIFALALDVALALGLGITLWLARHRGVPPLRTLDLSLWVLIAALAGARAWYVASHWGDYAAHLPAVVALWEGGLALPGAVVAGALAVGLATRRSNLPVLPLADAASIGTSMAQAVGRLGCVPAGCAAGKAAAELPAWLPALPLPDASGLIAPRFPAQMVEACAELFLGLLLLRLWRSRSSAGRVAFAYLAGYCAIRIAAQPFRA
jgi:phosphatidylglycerol---prolipoprotein diacylglyceryl transferase